MSKSAARPFAWQRETWLIGDCRLLIADLRREAASLPAFAAAHIEQPIMQPAFPFVDISTPVELLSTMITPQNPAVLVRDFKTDKNFIITRSDVIRVLC